ncbi:amine dehydrogenase large subunit [Delftia acidovorans]|uniref:amine dehydrogenase large subunit n=1 Tax=Delftia acidovorans TaxID=80866 RepID=UPI003016583D
MNTWHAAALVAIFSVSAAFAALAAEGRDDLDAGARLEVAESHVTLSLTPTHARRLFILDTAFPAAQAAKTWIVDGPTGRIESSFSQAYWPNFAVSPDGSELYAVDSYWEKHTRGKRQDFLVVRDARSLDILAEIALPNGRLLVVTKKHNFAVTPDGRYALSYNLAPRTSVSVVDLKERRYLGDIDIAGCGLVFAHGDRRFSTLCADGSVATVAFDEKLQADMQRTASVFDAQKDPAFEHSGWDRRRQKLYLLTYSGTVVPVDLSGTAARSLEPWPLTSRQEKAAGWLPGGWQVSAFHGPSQRLYVLMHKGHEWTHKDAGTEVWVFDAVAGKRVQRIKLKEKAHSVAVSQDAQPLVYVIAENTDILALDAATGKPVSRLDKLGMSPQILTVADE